MGRPHIMIGFAAPGLNKWADEVDRRGLHLERGGLVQAEGALADVERLIVARVGVDVDVLPERLGPAESNW